MTLRPRPEPVHVVKSRREAALQWLTGGVPYIQFLGIQFDRRGGDIRYGNHCGHHEHHNERIRPHATGRLQSWQSTHVLLHHDNSSLLGQRHSVH